MSRWRRRRCRLQLHGEVEEEASYIRPRAPGNGVVVLIPRVVARVEAEERPGDGSDRACSLSAGREDQPRVRSGNRDGEDEYRYERGEQRTPQGPTRELQVGTHQQILCTLPPE